MKQTANTILMIEPIAFGFNEETAGNNYFQQRENDVSPEKIQKQALIEFTHMVKILRNEGINVIVVQDTAQPHTPDSIFPNNWVSFHEDGRIVLYPMYAENRRKEKRFDIFEMIREKGFFVQEMVDYSIFAEKQLFLEGTGSMVLDRTNKIAYAALSERTNKILFSKFCNDFNYSPVLFSAYQTIGNKRLPIYHTNVMMCVGEKFAVVCLDSIDNNKEKSFLIESLLSMGKDIIEISELQMHQFAGNMLQVENCKGEKLLLMSQSAFHSLTAHQLDKIKSYNEVINIPIPTIEKQGGGSVRCMIAEIFLQTI